MMAHDEKQVTEATEVDAKVIEPEEEKGFKIDLDAIGKGVVSFLSDVGKGVVNSLKQLPGALLIGVCTGLALNAVQTHMKNQTVESDSDVDLLEETEETAEVDPEI